MRPLCCYDKRPRGSYDAPGPRSARQVTRDRLTCARLPCVVVFPSTPTTGLKQSATRKCARRDWPPPRTLAARLRMRARSFSICRDCLWPARRRRTCNALLAPAQGGPALPLRVMLRKNVCSCACLNCPAINTTNVRGSAKLVPCGSEILRALHMFCQDHCFQAGTMRARAVCCDPRVCRASCAR